MRSLHWLVACLLPLLLCSCRGAAGATQPQKKQCGRVCEMCESLHVAQVRRLCAARVLGRCGCAKFAVDEWHKANASRCPAVASFCPSGHVQDSRSGCSSHECALPPSCPSNWRQRCSSSSSSSSSSSWCPLGHSTDSAGCPTCACACSNATQAAAACAASCAKLGAGHSLLPQPAGCPSCLCLAAGVASSSSSSSSSSRCQRRCSRECGSYGHVNATLNSSGCASDCSCRCPSPDMSRCPSACPVTWRTDSFGCQVCACATKGEWIACPPAAACPSACPSRQRVWRADSRGCAVCSCRACPQLRCPADCGSRGSVYDAAGCPTCQCRCPPVAAACPGAECDRWTTDARGCYTCAACRVPRPCVTLASKAAELRQLCPSNCSQALQLLPGANGCLSCSCADSGKRQKCPQQPKCLLGCGPHPRKLDADGCVTSCDCKCPPFSADGCAAGCARNATVLVDSYGCSSCSCPPAPRCRLRFVCSNSCGHRGYEADASGCQASCRCNCPQRRCGVACDYGTSVDEFGCDTCQCKTFQQFVAGFF